MYVESSLYYLRCTFRNRTLEMLRKLRQPKYLIGFGLTAAYFWFVFSANQWFQPIEGAAPAAPEALRVKTTVVIGLFYLLQVCVTWFALSSGRGVAFREAEVQLLFPRPFTRWQILLLKWMAAQFPVVIGAVIIGLMLQRFGEFRYGCIAAGFWLSSTALYANATLMGLWLARIKERGGRAARWTQLPGWLLVSTLLVCVWLGWSSVGGSARVFADWHLLFLAPSMHWFLLPFTGLAAVMTAPDLPSFALAAIYPLALIAVQAIVIWKADMRFEDQAVDIAEKIQNLSRDGLTALRSKDELVVKKSGAPWALAPTGPVWRALVWKNLISIGRIPRRALFRIALVVIVVGIFLTGALIDEGDARTRVGYLILILTMYASLLAPSFIRVDLRIDIPHFDVLKAMPLSGRSLILGEIMATVVVVWGLQLCATVAAAFLVREESGVVFTATDRLCGVVALASSFFAVDFLMVTAENLLALWMPGFVRLGRGLRPGFDHMGQNLIGALVRMAVLMLSFVAPVGAGAVIGAVVSMIGAPLSVAIATGCVAGSAVLVLEAWLLIVLSEARYERFDITSEKITTGE